METWKPVLGFEGNYEVSNLGNARRITDSRSYSAGRMLKPVKMAIGYTKVSLFENRKSNQRYIHRLVAEAFLGKCPVGITVNHKNGIRDDNRLENLEYATRSQQETHAIQVLGKTTNRGERHPRAKLTEDQVRAIRALCNTHKVTWIAEQFGVYYTTVSAIRDRKRWSHLK